MAIGIPQCWFIVPHLEAFTMPDAVTMEGINDPQEVLVMLPGDWPKINSLGRL